MHEFGRGVIVVTKILYFATLKFSLSLSHWPLLAVLLFTSGPPPSGQVALSHTPYLIPQRYLPPLLTWSRTPASSPVGTRFPANFMIELNVNFL